MWSQRSSESLIVQTPAKLNLFLEILGKRSDGYHELESLMVTVDWYDTLRVTPLERGGGESPGSTRVRGPGDAVDRESDFHFTEYSSDGIDLRCVAANRPVPGAAEAFDVPSGAENLVVRAARLLRDAAGVRDGVRIDLIKRIPSAAGLAGGSSDAAATLWALNRIWGLRLPPEELRRLASQLGSDVAFFLSDRSAAVCRGRGELIEPLSLPLPLHFVLARPAHGLSTALVYRHCEPSSKPRGADSLVECLRSGRASDAGRQLFNALQAPAERLSSEVGQLTSLFSREPVLGHLMSGSGTACFGLFANRRQAMNSAARLRAAGVPHVAVAQSRS